MSARFDGDGDYARSSGSYGDNAALSVSCWFRVPEGAAVSEPNRVLELGGRSVGGGVTIEFMGSPAANVRARVWTSGFGTGHGPFTPGSWHHALVTSAAEGWMIFYVDSLPIGGVGGGRTQEAHPITLAGENASPHGDNPQIDIAEVAIWEGVLLDEQAATLAGGVNATEVAGANLVAYWPLRSNFNNVITSDHLTPSGNATIIGDHPFGAVGGGAAARGAISNMYRTCRLLNIGISGVEIHL